MKNMILFLGKYFIAIGIVKLVALVMGKLIFERGNRDCLNE